MTATVQQLLDLAEHFVGLTEEPPGSNHIRFWHDLGLDRDQGQSWCGAFVSAVHLLAGCPLPKVDVDHGFVYCPDGVKYAQAHHQWIDKAHGQPGDVALFDEGALNHGHPNGVAGHTGLVRAVTAGGYFTVEGNTSAAAGSQSNGGCVANKTRATGTVLGFWRPGVTAPAGTPMPAPKGVPYPGRVIAQGSPDHASVRLIQGHLHIPQDGVYGPSTFQAVEASQRAHKLTVDGQVGPATWRAIFGPI